MRSESCLTACCLVDLDPGCEWLGSIIPLAAIQAVLGDDKMDLFDSFKVSSVIGLAVAAALGGLSLALYQRVTGDPTADCTDVVPEAAPAAVEVSAPATTEPTPAVDAAVESETPAVAVETAP
jgi:hypothetical protein